MTNLKVYDLAIVGAGTAGLAGAMYAARLQMKSLLLGDNVGGLITWTDSVENYPGFKKLTGMELADKLKQHALEYKDCLEIVEEKVESVEKTGKNFALKTRKEEYLAKALIFATGTDVRKLPAKGAEEFERKGVHFCALCDGAFYKDKIVAVVGGSDAAVKDALVMARFAKKVYVIYRRDKLRGEPSNVKKLEDAKNTEIIYSTNIVEVKGSKFVEKIVLDKEYKGSKELALQGIFVAIGHTPLSDLAVGLGVKVNDKKEIIIDREAKTNVEGVFAAGDVVDTKFKQAIVGAGEAVVAVYSAYSYLSGK